MPLTPVPAAAGSVRTDVRTILGLGLPLLVNNLALAGMSLADTVMGGRLGAHALAAIAVGVAYYHLFMVLGMGLTMALSPLIAHAYGRGEARAVADYATTGLWAGLGIALLLVAGLWGVGPVLAAIGTDGAIRADAAGYVHAMAAGIPAFVGYQVLRFASEGLGRTRPMMVIAVFALAANVALNWVFMYGRLGAPALGAVGTGVATALVQWLMCGALAAHVLTHRAYRPYVAAARPRAPRAAAAREMLALGVPIGGSLVAEGGLFSTAGLMIGTLGAVPVAAHQVALNYAAFMFMAPLALHSATTIHVGHALGRGDLAGGRRAGFVGIGLCASIMAVSAGVLVLANDAIAGLYTADPAVRALAAHLLLLAGLFQLSDGLQVGAAGALRGYKDATVPLLLCVAAYWGIGFPLAFGLGVVRGQGPVGVWVGLISGLTVAAFVLNLRFLRRSRLAPRPATV